MTTKSRSKGTQQRVKAFIERGSLLKGRADEVGWIYGGQI